jgi:uncharacterized membrane protein
MSLFISFIGAVMVFGLLVLVLALKVRRDAKKSTASACNHGHVCQCRLAQHTIQAALAKDTPEK